MKNEKKLGGRNNTEVWTVPESEGQIRINIDRSATVLITGLQANPRLLVAPILFIEQAVVMVQLIDRAAIMYLHPEEESWSLGAPAGFDQLDGWDELHDVVAKTLDDLSRSVETFVLERQWERS